MYSISISSFSENYCVKEFVKITINIDYFMVDECVRFLFTSCERLLTNEWAQWTSELVIFHNEWIKSYKRDNHEVICLSYEYKDECRVYTEYFSDTDRRL